jgi:hypothetical protein
VPYVRNLQDCVLLQLSVVGGIVQVFLPSLSTAVMSAP